ncbi:MAG: DUF4389 domain-containing protein [Wenzhouxiangellaceae bacterium]|nr:MAG: DUF4389 domain-containing protein [Wenzhouxiangellaceae bacterium]
MDERMRAALKDPATWLRLPVMLLFFALLLIAVPVLIAVTIYGWCAQLLTGKVPDPVLELGRRLGDWLDRCARYLSGAAERRPFPFEDLDCPRDPPPWRAAAPSAPVRAAKPAADDLSERSPGSRSPMPAESSPAVAEAAKPASSNSAGKAGKKSTGKKAVSKKTATKKAAGKKTAGKKAAKKSSAKKKAGKKKPSARAGSAGASVEAADGELTDGQQASEDQRPSADRRSDGADQS